MTTLEKLTSIISEIAPTYEVIFSEADELNIIADAKQRNAKIVYIEELSNGSVSLSNYAVVDSINYRIDIFVFSELEGNAVERENLRQELKEGFLYPLFRKVKDALNIKSIDYQPIYARLDSNDVGYTFNLQVFTPIC